MIIISIGDVLPIQLNITVFETNIKTLVVVLFSFCDRPGVSSGHDVWCRTYPGGCTLPSAV